MSFYGQVLYEFSRLFSKINIQNNNSGTAAAVNPNAQESLSPTEEWDQLTIAGGNRWIQLNSNKNNKIITISHATPGEVDNSKTIVSFAPVDSVPDGATVIELPAGTIVRTSSNEYDAAGHAKDATTSYFKLPANKTEQDLNSITERVTQLEETYVAENEFNNMTKAYLNENQYIQSEEFETKTQNYLDEKKYINSQNLEENEKYATTKITGTLDEMYGNEEAKTLASTIGTMVGENSFIGDLKELLNYPDDYDIQFTLSEAIKALCETAATQSEELQRVQLAQAELLILNNELRTRIEALEKTPTE